MKKYNLVVCGGGFSGVAAAISAAREGMKVLIVEKNGSFGGAMSHSLVYPFCPYWTTENRRVKSIVNDGLFTEMRRRAYAKEWGDREYELASLPINLEDGDNKLRYFSPEYFKAVLDDMILESGADVLFHATVFGACTESRTVKAVKIATKTGEMTIEADYFIDATGDAQLAYLAVTVSFSGLQAAKLCLEEKGIILHNR